MQAPTAAPDAAPAAAAARTTGLDTPFKSVGASKKRAAPVMMPLRTGKIWATVTVVGQEMSQTPNVVCKDCGHPFCGGNTRIVEHILSKCTCTTSELQALRAELLTEKEKKAGKAGGGEVGHRLGQLRRLGRRARPGRLERGRRAARREGARAAERRGAAGAQDTEGEG